MELADKIKEESIKLFFGRGIKAVSMDDVAKSVGISKRTLYETFASKDALLVSCLDLLYSERLRKLDAALRDGSKSFIETMLASMYSAMSFLQTVNPVFFEDLNRLNCANVRETMNQSMDVYRKKMQGLIEDGKRDGYLRKEVDSEFISYVILGNDRRDLPCFASLGRWSLPYMLRHLVAIFLRGMATSKGVEQIDALLAHMAEAGKLKNTKIEI